MVMKQELPNVKNVKGMKYQKRHYEDIAKLLGRANDGQAMDKQTWKIALRFAAMFEADNPRFDRNRFIAKIGSYSGQATTEELEILGVSQ
jgi:hypothetical protein